MKKLLTIIAVFGLVASASAQKTWTFGPKVGINFANIHSDDSEENDAISGMKPGLTIGAFVECRAVNWLGVSAEVLYSRKGSALEHTVSVAGSSVKNDIKNRFNYLDVPILANFYIVKGLAIKAGIQPSFLLSAKSKVKTTATINGDSESKTVTTDGKDMFKTVDFAIPVGISYSFNMGLIVDLRYNIPCTNIVKEKEAFDGKLTNQVAALSLGWRF